MRQAVFTVREPPTLTSCAVFSSPHSGRAYPPDLVARSRLPMAHLRLSEDAYVEELFAAAPAHGAPLLAANMPRAYVDLNRGPAELDPALIEGVRAHGLNPRVAAGLGVVPRVVAEGVPIYSGKLPAAEALRRIDRIHAPYHEALGRLLDTAHQVFGIAMLFDCHSMPSDALRSVAGARGRRPDVVLGDRYGASAGGWVMDQTQAVLEAAGFVVARNAPFAGGYITQRYGRPARGYHAIQIELDRSLYLDEVRIEPGAGFDATRSAMSEVVAALARIGGAGGRRNLPLAAE
jgi:N-formylglutamate deformylase